ncbi:segregation and condensation protein A [Psychrobacter cryohalolentis]|uniref:Segregation and condensation protein A n=1 Tax=Psychrobacter cryohalolentis (strain ATCC BAA-1226 / DSM 17306 / VKM B-2378 / K5) TaxID=335284 RepID=Q1Q9X5_PSYCK|nr:segregation/condensation protein A [Psychrobacter cryohalolentis]ABE75528.1 condensin subunit ScpA [Psychrobacter cryohalolentis K5]ASE25718.1 segregation/condensation protein A [Psychrobacter cryohalolentis]
MQSKRLIESSAEIHDMSLRIYQTPIQHLPEDLYVPPQAFAIWLEQFAGPLDFLLYLVKKNNVDLTRMPILPITEQYLAYISELDTNHFELAGDYLLMASTLIAIKTELLLPKPEKPTDERDPKAELIERLEEYAQVKAASQRLDNLIRLERDVFLAMVSMPSQDIMNAELPSYSPTLLIDSLFKMQLQPDYQMHSIKVDAVPLADRIASISRQLSMDGARSFYELLDKTQGKIGVVVSFVAVLELIKRQLIGVVANSTDNHVNTANNADISLPTHNDLLGKLTLEWLA